MGSANGRHRRPRQAPAIVVAAGVTGSAIAIPLLGASGATAAEASTWDRVAECESGGMWSADLGNGYYGGLQFSQETWSAYGGTEFAPRADLASRSQQISVAEKVLDDQGPKAWPSCAVISGLAVDGSLPGVDPGTSPAPDPSTTPTDEADASDEADESGKSGEADESGEGDKGDESGRGGKGDPADKGDSADAEKGGEAPDSSVTPSTPPSSEAPGATDPSTAPDSSKGKGGKHRGAPAPEEAGAGQEDGPRGSGRHASRGDGDARDGGAATDAYTVQPGDNLWAIADAQELPDGWTGLYEANKDLLGSDPDLILPGQNLDLGLDQAVGQAAPEGAEEPAEEPAEAPAAN
ncbi:transglycosylase family protein [Streptomyces globisporus]|uniref:LysM peptidoglycan-binding domain-containing protein n=1 Tax=Streptomyces globisporus TaxID=1908 RepID=A0A423V6K5_STRGL|nr:transglycosylase family protein [Streptomyces globisporus]ROV70240.1 LysM peptidoglycan-binding domain-containing protein [Streptomyces globisporus]